MTLFDASAWTGMWPFTMSAPVGLDELVVCLRRAGIGGAAVSPLNAVLAPEPQTSNLALIDAAAVLVGDFDLRIVPLLDPSLPGWERDLDSVLEAGRDLVGSVKIVPNYHRYEVDGDAATALARRATSAGLGICVQMRILDERAHHPLMQMPGVPAEGLARLAQVVPDARFLACGVYQAELAALADAPNVSVELSSVESGDALANALAVVGPERPMLGTHVPVYEPASGVAKVRGVTEDAVAARVGWENATAFFQGGSERTKGQHGG